MTSKISMLVLLVWLTVPTLAAKLKIDPDQRYLLLATTKTGTMQKELDEASALGFRIVVGSPTSGNEMVLLLEKVAEPPETYKYLILATTRTSTMQKELAEAAEEGYRLLTNTMISKKTTFGGPEIVVVLERPPDVKNEYQYLLLATSKTSTLQIEITESIADGYSLAGMVSRGEHMVIMEKEILQSE